MVADEIAAKLFRDKGEDDGEQKNSVMRTASSNNTGPAALIKNDYALSVKTPLQAIDPRFDLTYFLLISHLL